MAINNTVELIGNIGSEARIIETTESTFATVSIATTDSYKDKDDNWQDKETIWHNVIVFNPKLIESLKSFKKGTRLKVIGSLDYRIFEVQDGEGKIIKKKEVSIIGRKIEQAPLAKKKQEA
ncbi:MAG: single-stranded DNA-binding protein [Bacteroidota bacterium]